MIWFDFGWLPVDWVAMISEFVNVNKDQNLPNLNPLQMCQTIYFKAFCMNLWIITLNGCLGACPQSNLINIKCNGGLGVYS